MSDSHNRYIAIETTISAFINGIISCCIAYLTFRSLNEISAQALIIDALPQSFFVTFFSALVPTFLVRRRLRKGMVDPLPFSRNRWPENILLRALVAGIVVSMLAGIGYYAALTVMAFDNTNLTGTLVHKTLYGVLLAFIITPLAIRLALSENPEISENMVN